MQNERTIHALIRKRAEIAGQIECHQDALNQLIVDLDNVGHTLRLFAPEIYLEEIAHKPIPPRNQAFKGEMKRIVLEALRKASGPLKSKDLTEIVLKQRGLGSANARLRGTITERVCAALRHCRIQAPVVSEKGNGGLLAAVAVTALVFQTC